MNTPTKLLSVAVVALTAVTAMCCVAAFGDHSVPEPEDQDVLVVYFSKSGVTQTVAEMAASYANADIFEITAEDPYAESDYQCQKRAQVEKTYNLRPAMASSIGDLSGYDTILLGFPIWFSDCPMIVCTFLDEHEGELVGKTIIPFATSNVTGIKGAMKTITEQCDESNVIEGILLDSNTLVDSERLVREWISDLNLTKT